MTEQVFAVPERFIGKAWLNKSAYQSMYQIYFGQSKPIRIFHGIVAGVRFRNVTFMKHRWLGLPERSLMFLLIVSIVT